MVRLSRVISGFVDVARFAKRGRRDRWVRLHSRSLGRFVGLAVVNLPSASNELESSAMQIHKDLHWLRLSSMTSLDKKTSDRGSLADQNNPQEMMSVITCEDSTPVSLTSRPFILYLSCS